MYDGMFMIFSITITTTTSSHSQVRYCVYDSMRTALPNICLNSIGWRCSTAWYYCCAACSGRLVLDWESFRWDRYFDLVLVGVVLESCWRLRKGDGNRFVLLVQHHQKHTFAIYSFLCLKSCRRCNFRSPFLLIQVLLYLLWSWSTTKRGMSSYRPRPQQIQGRKQWQ